MEYKKRLRNLRKDSNTTQAQIAKVLYVRQGTVSKCENGLREYTVEDLIRLCKFYNVSADYILGLTDEYKALSQIKKDLQ